MCELLAESHFVWRVKAIAQMRSIKKRLRQIEIEDTMLRNCSTAQRSIVDYLAICAHNKQRGNHEAGVAYNALHQFLRIVTPYIGTK